MESLWVGGVKIGDMAVEFTDDEKRDLLATLRKQIEKSKNVRARNKENADKMRQHRNVKQEEDLVKYLDGKIERLENCIKKLEDDGE